MNKQNKSIHFYLSDNLPIVVFVFSYFFTIVLGNILFLFKSVENDLSVYGYIKYMYELGSIDSYEYWFLLLFPIFIVPFIGIHFKKHLRRVFQKTYVFNPIGAKWVILLFAIVFIFIAHALYRTNAWSLLFSADNAIAAVENRFLVLSRLSFFDKILIMSIFPFISFIYLVDFFKRKNLVKFTMTFVMVFLVSISLFMLNMKWPILIYFFGIVCIAYCCELNRPILYTIIGVIFVVLMYLIVSSFIFRLHDNKIESRFDAELVSQDSTKSVENLTSKIDGIKENTFALLVFPVFRMAAIPPYYFKYKKKEGSLCGGQFGQFKRGAACRPSTYIYGKIFPDDKFVGIGTAPSSTHITAYALGGVSLSIVSIILVSLILGFFSYFEFKNSSVDGAFKIYGAIVGYHYSQLPFEGPLIYDHGFLWIGIFIFLVFLLRSKLIKFESEYL